MAFVILFLIMYLLCHALSYIHDEISTIGMDERWIPDEEAMQAAYDKQDKEWDAIFAKIEEKRKKEGLY